MADGAIKILTNIDTSGVKNGLTKMSGLIFRGVSTIAKSITAATGLASGSIVGMIGAGLKFAGELESGMAKASTLVDTTTEEGVRNLERMKKAFLETSAATGQAASGLAEAGYQALSAGVSAEDAGEFVDRAAKLATGGFTDTASAVDLMTTAINAYGLDAKDAQRISDTLIMTQNKGKTTVGELAASLGRVAPSAAAMNVSLEDTETALAQMTKGGISTAESATYLKGMINELGKDGTKVSTILKQKTGKSFADLTKEGQSLGDVLDILAESVEGDTTAFANLWQSQEAGTGALSIVNQGTKDYNETLQAISGTAGATEDAVAKMMDTAEGKMNRLKESARNLGMSIVDNLKDKFKDALDAGIGYVDELKAAFEEGGLAGVVGKAGEVFANIAVRAAEEAPKIVEAAVTMIQNFVRGIAEHKDELLRAAGQIVETLVTGIADLLPAQIGQPIKEMVQTIKKSLADGALKRAIQNLIKFFINLASAVLNLVNKVLPVFLKIIEFVCDHLDVLIPIVLGAVAAFKLFSVVQMVIGWLTKLAAVFPMLTTAVTALSGPVGIIIALIGGLAAGIGAFILFTSDSSSEVDIFNEKLAEEADAIREVQKARDEEVKSAGAQWDYYEQLWQELQQITDANGKIKEGYEERAAFITSTLSEATGVEIEIVDGVIQKYGELEKQILGVMEVKRAEAMLSAYQDSYKTAIENQTQAIQDQATAYNNLEAARQELEAAEQEAAADMTVETAWKRRGELSSAVADRLREAEQSVSDCQKAFDDANTILGEYNATITNYEAVMGAAEAGSADLNVEVMRLSNGFLDAAHNTEDGLKAQYDAAVNGYESLKQAVADGNTAISEQQLADAEAYVAICGLEYAKAGEVSAEQVNAWNNRVRGLVENSGIAQAAETEIKNMGAAQVNAMNIASGEISHAAYQAGDSANLGFNRAQVPQKVQTQTKDAMLGIINTMSGYAGRVMTGGQSAANSGIQGIRAADMPGKAGGIASDAMRSFVGPLDDAASTIGEKGRSLGENYISGISNGIHKYVRNAIDAARNAVSQVIQAGNAAAQVKSPSKKGVYLGEMYDAGIAVGVEENVKLPVRAVRKMAETLLDRMDVFDIGERVRSAVSAETQRINQTVAGRMLSAAAGEGGTAGSMSQTVNIYQPVKTPVETARELKKAGRELAFAYG